MLFFLPLDFVLSVGGAWAGFGGMDLGFVASGFLGRKGLSCAKNVRADSTVQTRRLLSVRCMSQGGRGNSPGPSPRGAGKPEEDDFGQAVTRVIDASFRKVRGLLLSDVRLITLLTLHQSFVSVLVHCEGVDHSIDKWSW